MLNVVSLLAGRRLIHTVDLCEGPRAMGYRAIVPAAFDTRPTPPPSGPQRPGMAYNRQAYKDAPEEERGYGAAAEARAP
jgi:hypothetical protein